MTATDPPSTAQSSTGPDTPNPAEAGVVVYSSGLVACSVCAPSGLTREQVEDVVNRLHPTGISSCWAISTDPTFRQGGPQPGLCEQSPGERTHYLMEC